MIATCPSCVSAAFFVEVMPWPSEYQKVDERIDTFGAVERPDLLDKLAARRRRQERASQVLEFRLQDVVGCAAFDLLHCLLTVLGDQLAALERRRNAAIAHRRRGLG